MTIPSYQQLMRPVLDACADRDELATSDLIEQMADRFDLSAEERAQLLPTARQTVIANRTHWAVTYLLKAGLLERTRRAHYRMTEKGRSARADREATIDLRYLRRFPELAAFVDSAPTSAEVSPPADEGATPDEMMRTAHARIEAALRGQLLDRVVKGKPEFFESLVVRLLVAMGFGNGTDDTARAIGGSGDNGVDGVIDQDPLGLDRIYVQAKRYSPGNTVGPAAIRDFFGSLDLHRAGKGVFITTSAFTESARATAERLGKRIVLIDGERLTALMIRHDVGVRIAETLHIKKIDEDLFSE